MQIFVDSGPINPEDISLSRLFRDKCLGFARLE